MTWQFHGHLDRGESAIGLCDRNAGILKVLFTAILKEATV
jgi:hypothetical protein